MSRHVLFTRSLIALCALAAAVAVPCSTATPTARDRGKKPEPPTLLWKLYPLAPQGRRAARARPTQTAQTTQSPPTQQTTRSPPTQTTQSRPTPTTRSRPTHTTQARSTSTQSSYQISTDRRHFPSLLLVAVFLGGLLTVGLVLLVRWRSVPIGVPGAGRRRTPPPARAPLGAGDDLLEALQPPRRPEPDPVPEPVVADTARLEATGTRQQPEPRPKSTHRLTHREEANVARCEIRLWRGLVKCQLHAVLAASEGEPFASSPYFRLEDDDVASPQAERSLSALAAELERDGWTVVSDGPSWYQHRFERFE
jgi:hypothetical protein